jgi:MoaD family protein
MSDTPTKKITVRYFALFRENAGIDQEVVESSASTAAELFASLVARHGSREPLGHCKVAINDEMADWEDALEDGDTVLLFPPVAGG